MLSHFSRQMRPSDLNELVIVDEAFLESGGYDTLRRTMQPYLLFDFSERIHQINQCGMGPGMVDMFALINAALATYAQDDSHTAIMDEALQMGLFDRAVDACLQSGLMRPEEALCLILESMRDACTEAVNDVHNALLVLRCPVIPSVGAVYTLDQALSGTNVCLRLLLPSEVYEMLGVFPHDPSFPF